MSDQFKSLLLDRTKLEAAVHEFANMNGFAVTRASDEGKYFLYEIARTGEKTASLQVFFRADDTTTLHPKVGKNQPISEGLAQYIAANCSRKAFAQLPLVLDSITEADWEFLIAHLRDDHGFTVEAQALDHGERYKVVGNHKDVVFLHRYNTGRFLMQGKAHDVYGIVAATLCELVPNKESIVQAQLASFDLTEVNVGQLLDELKGHIPTAYEFMGETGRSILAPSLAYTRLKMELPDYTSFAFPAIRGLEAYLKLLFARGGCIVKNQSGFGDFFNGTSLKSGVKGKFPCAHTVSAIEASYYLHTKHRNGLFHADANPEMSRLIETHEEACSLIYGILRAIEASYTPIHGQHQ